MTARRCDVFYQTQYTDPQTGDVLAQSRWYSPTSATFRSRDTWAGDLNTPVTLNRYTYAGNNPIRYWDPSGFCFVPVEGAPPCSPELLAGLDTAGAVNAAVGIQEQIGGGFEEFFEASNDHPLSVVSIAQGIEDYATETGTGVYQAGEEIRLVLLESDTASAVFDTYSGIQTQEMGTSVVITRGLPWLLGGAAAILGMSSTDKLELDPADRIGESFEIIRDWFNSDQPGSSAPAIDPNTPLPVPNPGIPADFTNGGFSAVQNPVSGLIFASGKWMTPGEFANDVIRDTRNRYRGSPTETGQHGSGLRAAARDLREQAANSGYLQEINELLLEKARQWDARARGIDHPGGR